MELERTLAHVSPEKTERCLNLESYRQLRLYGTREANIVWFLTDHAEIRPAIMARRRQPAAAQVEAQQ